MMRKTSCSLYGLYGAQVEVIRGLVGSCLGYAYSLLVVFFMNALLTAWDGFSVVNQ